MRAADPPTAAAAREPGTAHGALAPGSTRRIACPHCGDVVIEDRAIPVLPRYTCGACDAPFDWQEVRQPEMPARMGGVAVLPVMRCGGLMCGNAFVPAKLGQWRCAECIRIATSLTPRRWPVPTRRRKGGRQ